MATAPALIIHFRGFWKVRLLRKAALMSPRFALWLSRRGPLGIYTRVEGHEWDRLEWERNEG
jgi:hypothetical protein